MFKKKVNAIKKDLVTFLLKLGTSFRYRTILKGLNQIPLPKAGEPGILFLYNHTSLLDGVFAGVTFWRSHKAIAVVVEDHFINPNGRWLFRLFDMISIPNFTTGTYDWKEKKLQEALDRTEKLLKEGKNVYVFPSGGIKLTAYERLGGSSFVFRLLQQYPEARFALVRIRGMWGSAFSIEPTGQVPNLYQGWGKRFGYMFANLLFFMPKRPVYFDVDPGTEFPRSQGKLAINHYLESWYNLPYEAGEPVIHYPHFFWQKNPPEIQSQEKHPPISLGKDLENKVINDIAELFQIPSESLSAKTKLGSELGLDSLELAKLALYVETTYDVPMISLDELSTIDDVFRWITSQEAVRKPTTTPDLALPQKKLILDAPLKLLNEAHEKLDLSSQCASFVKIRSSSSACCDLWHQPWSYSQFNSYVEDLSVKIRRLPSKHVGIMMLNSVEAMATLLAIYQAKKTPLIIDWKSVDFKLKVRVSYDSLPILTSRGFVDRLNMCDLNGLEEQSFFIENFQKLSNEKDSSSKLKNPKILNENLSELLESALLNQSHYESICKKLLNCDLGREKMIAIIHDFTQPYEVGVNVQLLLSGRPVFFLSAYRMSSRELGHYLRAWNFEVIICSQEILHKLRDKILPTTKWTEL